MKTQPDSNQTDPSSLRSSFADDQEMSELILFFVQAMDERIEALRSAHQDGDMVQLQRLAHQLKGAATGYGFATITEHAATVDALLRDDPAGLNEQAITDATQDLIRLCSSVRS